MMPETDSGSIPHDTDALLSGVHPSHPHVPAVEDASGLGGSIWIVLFGGVMVLSVVANVLLAGCILSNRKKHSPIYFMMVFMFAINLVDYAMLIFEFSLGVEHMYPYLPSTCAAYQVFVKGTPILQAATVLVVLHYASSVYCTLESSPSSRHPDTATGCSRTNNLVVFFGFVVGLLVIGALFSIPTALFSSIVTVQDNRYCEIDLGSVAPEQSQQQAISIFYLLYSAILSFWLPLLLAIRPLYKLYRSSSNNDKYPEVSVVTATTASFFVFYLIHGSVVFLRHFLDASGFPFSIYNTRIIKLAQSFFWLVAYFWHFTRPILAMLLDPDLKQDISRLFSRGEGNEYFVVDLPAKRGPNTLHVPFRPICKPSIAAKNVEKGDNEETTALDRKVIDSIS